MMIDDDSRNDEVRGPEDIGMKIVVSEEKGCMESL